jgi:2-methylcitrate dehydratase PrpD
MAKSFHAGRAAENGITAALLARQGFTGAKTALEGSMGLFPLMADEFDPTRVRDLGRPWGIVDPAFDRAVVFKLYPCCGSGDGAIDGMLALMEENGIRAEDVAAVEVYGHEKKLGNLRYHRPQTGLEAKFSMEYWMAVALLKKKAGLKQFTDRSVQDPKVQEFMEKVKFIHDPEVPRFPVRIEVKLRDGRSCKKMYWPFKGYPENPISDEDLIAKYRDCAEWFGLPQARTEKSIRLLMEFEKLSGLDALLRLMVK